MTLPDFALFNPAQRQAFFELLVLTMYADGNLSAVEDEHLQRFLGGMGCEDCQRALDETATKTRPFLKSIRTAKDRMLELAASFTTRQQHLQVFKAVEEMVLSDGHIAAWESTLLTELRLKFRV
jgi:uncharacterized tellurite resistance protein B-like protein